MGRRKRGAVGDGGSWRKRKRSRRVEGWWLRHHSNWSFLPAIGISPKCSRNVSAGRLAHLLPAQPAVEPRERFVLHVRLITMRLVVERAAEAFGNTGLRVDFFQLLDRRLHARHRVKLIAVALLDEQRARRVQRDLVRQVERTIEARDE